MGLFGKREYPDDEIQRVPPDQDVEKTLPAQMEVAPAQPPAKYTPSAIDPELERRVVRKLDLRVPTLMGFFCMTVDPKIEIIC
jgi:hypothetical protein